MSAASPRSAIRSLPSEIARAFHSDFPRKKSPVAGRAARSMPLIPARRRLSQLPVDHAQGRSRRFIRRKWLVRIECAITNDTDLCPGTMYVQFDLDGLLRADSKTRAEVF